MRSETSTRQGFARRVEALLTPLFRALAVLAAVAATAIVGLIGASVIMRHLANAPFRFTEELVGLLMTAAFFLVLPLVTLRADHVRVQIALTALPARARGPVGMVAGMFGVVFCGWFAWLTLPWLDFAFAREIKSEVARLLLYPWMALVPLSLVLSGVAFALRATQPPPARR